jgi:pyruvate dehydrogenase E2 component (dihydrolipoamide acetyltransferase)
MSEKVLVPDVGEAENVEVIEVLVAVGNTVEKDESLVVLESSKASMEIPSPFAAVVSAIAVTSGDTVDEGDLILELESVAGESPKKDVSEVQEPADPDSETPPVETVEKTMPAPPSDSRGGNAKVHAGPAVRKQAREYGVQLTNVPGSGKYGRILKEDIKQYVKQNLRAGREETVAGIPPVAQIDFEKFGDVEIKPLSRVRKASARNLHRSWLNIPHVTQFDEADITELEIFRSKQNEELARDGIKVTPLAFLIRATVSALLKYPQFNASIDPTCEHMVLKKYINIGIAVETAEGLMVPVIRDADRKGVIALA